MQGENININLTQMFWKCELDRIYWESFVKMGSSMVHNNRWRLAG